MPSPSSSSATPTCPDIGGLPVEIGEEMALSEAALAAAARRPAPLSCASYWAAGDIEDSPPPLRRSLLARFRERHALAVTNITATEWCEKQMEFVLEHGKPERTVAMKAGSDRHAQLEKEETLSFWLGARNLNL